MVPRHMSTVTRRQGPVITPDLSTQKSQTAGAATEVQGVQATVTVGKTGYVGGKKSAGEHPDIKPWQSGIPHRTGASEDYGHGVHELTMEKHGHVQTFRYGKANSIPEVTLDIEKSIDSQVADISRQMVALMEGPVPKQIDAMMKKNRIKSPFDVDVVVDGQTVNLAKAKPGSLTPDFVNKALFEVVKQHTFKNVRADIAAFYGVNTPVGTTVNVTGAKALEKLEGVVTRAIELADKGFGPPLPKDPVRREEYIQSLRTFAMKNLFHGENLTTKHQVQGYDVLERNPDLNETLSHDLVDRSSIQAVLQIDPNALQPLWTRAWVLEEIQQQNPAEYKKLAGNASPDDAAKTVDVKKLVEAVKAHPEWTVNPNAGEARYLLPMYHWGDERNDADSMMHWHRAANHHDGDLEKGTLNVEQKRQNGVEHHAGTEHVGVRHEAGRGYDQQLPFERTIRKIWADSAFKHPFWRTAAMKDIVFQRVLQERGIITPEDLSVTPNAARYEKLDGAYQALQMANVGADKALRTLGPKIEFAAKLRAEIDAATMETAGTLPDKVASAAAKATPEQQAALWQYLQAKMIQQSSISTNATSAFMPVASIARDRAGQLGVELPAKLSPMKTAEALEHRAALNELKDAAAEARKGGDSALAAVYEMWNDIVSAGFPSQAH